jgi:ERCC4-type nuclease
MKRKIIEQIKKIEKMYKCKVITIIGNVYIVSKSERTFDSDDITTNIYIGVVIVKDNDYQYKCLYAYTYLTDLNDYKVRKEITKLR